MEQDPGKEERDKAKALVRLALEHADITRAMVGFNAVSGDIVVDVDQALIDKARDTLPELPEENIRPANKISPHHQQ